jgi:hypothetical protein
LEQQYEEYVPKEIVTVHSPKKIFFTVTTTNNILISSEEGHIEVYTIDG